MGGGERYRSRYPFSRYFTSHSFTHFIMAANIVASNNLQGDGNNTAVGSSNGVTMMPHNNNRSE